MIITSEKIKITQIKLVIWDLDNTFWNGTLTEGGCKKNERNIQLLKNLTDRGIVNSICSKNNFEDCRLKLEEWGVWNYFVFPSIDWTPKGKRVCNIIHDMGLRPCNVLFLDDEPSNLQAVKQYDSKIIGESIDNCIEELEKQLDMLSKDESRQRLKRYQELQRKVEIKNSFDSDEEFLRLSEIKVEIKRDCNEHFDRILELINRTNQLNFTKKRIVETGLINLLNSARYECGYIMCRDKFSEYGIVGFYALEKEKNNLEHFLFSCRTIGMGVEQYVYATLGFPQLNVVGDVVNELSLKEKPDWIDSYSKADVEKNKKIHKKASIIVKGPCDVSQVIPFFSGGANFYTEFAYVSEEKGGTYIESHNHSTQILKSLKKNNETNEKMRKSLFFVDSKFYSTRLFDEDFDYFIFSVLTDYSLGLYRNKKNHEIVVPFGQYTIDYTQKENWDNVKLLMGEGELEKKQKEYFDFCEKYEYIGRISDNQFISNLEQIRARLPEKTKVIFLNGAEIPYPGGGQEKWKDREIVHNHMNKILKEFVEKHESNCVVIDVNRYLTDEMPYLDNINHYKKNVYYNMAVAIQQYIDQDNFKLQLNNKNGNKIKIFERVKRKICKIIN